jgi:hypothetical protein
VDQGTDPEARDRGSGWGAGEDRAAGELVAAAPGRAEVLVRPDLAPACGNPVRPEAAVVPGRVAELVEGAVPVVERGWALVVPEVGVAPVAEVGPAGLAAVKVGVGMGLVGELEPVAVRERALVVVAPGAAVQVAVGMEVVEEQERVGEAEGLEPGRELEVQAVKARRLESGKRR